MGSIKRSERIERIERDDGALDDKVVYGPRNSVNSYHESVECVNAPDEDRCKTITRRQAHRQFRAPCKNCVLDEVDGTRSPTANSDTCNGTNSKGEPCGCAASVAGYCPEHFHQRGEDDD